ncbi:histidine kinase [Chondromyces crocatus]|uniref:histidine kinase n=1 Tax=Chondromyces crocatus TaxID=52 RepID=A0A0K1E9T7_CHOCO|nr:histidine kinase [Chondromyces crocatus]
MGRGATVERMHGGGRGDEEAPIRADRGSGEGSAARVRAQPPLRLRAAGSVSTPPTARSGVDTLSLQRMRPRSSFRLRVVAYAFGIELPFSLLVPVAYLRLLNIDDLVEQTRVLTLIGALHLLKTGALIAVLMRMLRPIDRLRSFGAGMPTSRSDAAGRSSSEPGSIPPSSLILNAGRAAYETPLAFGVLWAVSWALFYFPVTAALPMLAPSQGVAGPRLMAALLLFSLALFAAAMPLGYSILGRLLSPAAGLISLAARERDLAVPGRSFSVAARLVLLGVCLAVAPTSWMVAMVLMEVGRPAEPGGWISLVIFSIVAVSWAPVCAGFIAGALATPLRQVGAVIEKIIQRGDAERLERIPIHFKDEIGALAGGVNAMVDRLQESSARIRSYLAERERLLEDEAQRAAQLQAILDNLVEGVMACDAEGKLTMVNASALRLLGLPTPGASGGVPSVPACSVEELHELARMSHRDGRAFSRDELPMIRSLAGETIAAEEQVLTDPGTQREVFLLTSAAPIRGADGAILGAVTVARDVTESRELELVKDQFIRVGAHELKTPVAIMKGYALALLRAGADLPPARRQMLEAIDRGADRINRIVDDLLAISQITLDQFAVFQERVDLGRLVSSAVERVSTTAARHHIRLRLPAGKPIVARGDPERLRQVLASLLDNAVKYSPEGGEVEVSVAIAPRCSPTDRTSDPARSGPGLEAIVSVRDHGIGIPSAKQDRIFQRFFRAHTDTTHDYGGMGVGLFLARDMITRQGGRMWFESEECQGSVFHFAVPLEEGELAHG